jgi:hypothetical protein
MDSYLATKGVLRMGNPKKAKSEHDLDVIPLMEMAVCPPETN